MRRVLLTLILAVVVLVVPVNPALAQVVVPALEPCIYTGPVEAGIFGFVDLTPCDLEIVSD